MALLATITISATQPLFKLITLGSLCYDYYTGSIYRRSSRPWIRPGCAHSWWLPRLDCVDSRRLRFQFQHRANRPARCCQSLHRTRNSASIRCICTISRKTRQLKWYRLRNKKAVLSQRWPRDAPTKVNKQPHLHLRSRDSRLTQFKRRYGRRCWTNIFSPKFLHVPLGVGGWPLGYEEQRCWANCSRN